MQKLLLQLALMIEYSLQPIIGGMMRYKALKYTMITLLKGVNRGGWFTCKGLFQHVLQLFHDVRQ